MWRGNQNLIFYHKQHEWQESSFDNWRRLRFSAEMFLMMWQEMENVFNEKLEARTIYAHAQ